MTINSILFQSNKIRELSLSQSGMWLKEKLSGSDWSFMLAEAIEIRGNLNQKNFLAALKQLSCELPLLRSRIRELDGQPYQVSLDSYERQFEVVDFRGGADPVATADAWMDAEIRKPVDLAEDDLWRSALLRLDDEHWIWYHAAHHILLDGFSGGLLAHRVAELYSALEAGRAPTPCDFGSPDDLKAFEQSYRRSVHFERDRSYWQEQLKGLPDPVTLTRRKMEPVGGLLRHSVEVERCKIGAIEALGRQAGASLPQTLIALVASYYAKATDVEDLIILTMVTARISADMRRIPGMVANAVPLRFRIAPETTFSDLIRQVTQQMSRALRYQRYRYEDMRRDLNLSHRDQQIAWLGVNIEPFNYQLDFNGLPASARNLSNGTMTDLTIFAYDRGDGGSVRFDFDANPGLYDLEELVDHQTRFIGLVDSLVREPDVPLSQRSLLLPDERHKVLFDWNATGRPVELVSLPVLFARQVALSPQATAVIFGETSLSYGELDRQSDLWAGHLRRLGIASGDLVAVALPRSEVMVIMLMAILKSGAAYLPLDPSDRSDRLAAILAEARPAIVVTTTALESEVDLGAVPRVYQDLQPDVHPDLPDMVLPPPPGPQDTAYVIFTSGSTGRPKGVEIAHRGLSNFLLAMQETVGLTASDRVLAVTTIAFDIAVLELFLPLTVGAVTVIATRDTVREPQALRQLIQRERINVLQSTPSLWRALLRDGLGGLETVRPLVGGEALPPELAQTMAKLGAPILNLYGPTETTVWSTVMPLADDELAAPVIGRPIWNTEVYVVDRHGQPVPPGFVGELLIGGMGVAKGYLNRPDLTEERFAPDTFTGRAGRLYRTGDLVRWRADGVLDYVGRNDFQIKIRGFRIEPGEIEAALVAMDGIQQAVVVLRGDQGLEKRLVAYIVPEGEGRVPDGAELARRLAAVLPSHMVPSHFVTLPVLPLNGNGKIDRKALPPPPCVVQEDAVPPRNETERAIAALWCEVLGLESVGVHDDFFALGGDSLAAAGMISALRSRLNGEVPLGTVFATPTIAALAERLEVADEPHSLMQPMLPIKAHGNRPPLFCIHPLLGLGWGFFGLAQHVGEDVPIYALQADALSDAQAAPRSIEGMAARYLERIRSRQPHGPYHLLGWSLGGLVAHEITRLLREDGEQVAFLGMLDSYIFQTQAGHLDEKTLVEAGMAFLGGPSELADGIETLRGLGDYAVDRFYQQNSGYLSYTGLDDPKLVDRARQTILDNFNMAGRFVPGRVDVDLHFFRAGNVMAAAATRSVIHYAPEAWLPHVGGRIYLRTLDCGHDNMLDPQPAAEVGAVIQAELLREILVLRRDE
ncbi:MAG: amino acid adenylation domain-containing protein [Rhizobium sp.]|nr:amino acid adenylation domain-containing protein [Rhizobium sp.]MCZ8351534.1 amino acid adenylation domain-containing protein [Rhizobium sp.]